MPDFDDIRRGLAANLSTVLSGDLGHVSPYFNTSPPLPCLQIVGLDEMEHTDFGDGRRYVFVIEGVFSMAVEQNAQRLLDPLVDAVAEAVESDNAPTGSLFSRYQDDNTVINGQDPAADSVAFVRYRGQSLFTLRSGDEVLLASWLVEVLA